jgi:hypothetical protein
MSSKPPHPSVPSDALDAGHGVEGFTLEAYDGAVGTIACACDDGEGAFIVSSGGAWNGGLSTMLPTSLIERVDAGARKVVLRCALEQIRRAPAFENDRYRDGAFRRELNNYYESLFPSAFPLFEAVARPTGSLLSFGRETRGYPQATVS